MPSQNPPFDPQVGDELPPFTRAAGFAEWNRFAAVNDEFVPIHMDDGAGRSAGMSGSIGMGNLQWSYLHNLVRAWLPDGGRILTMACRFNSPSGKGLPVSARGRVSGLESREDGHEVALELWTENSDGTVLAPGTCTVLISG